MLRKPFSSRFLKSLTLAIIVFIFALTFQVFSSEQSNFLQLLGIEQANAADWPAFQHDAAHTGYNSDETVMLPLSMKWEQFAFFEYDEVKTRPIIIGDKVIIGVNDSYPPVNYRIYALSSTNGFIIWQFEPYEGGIRNLVAANGMVYFTTSAGKLYALDLETGALQWQISIGATYPGAPTVDGQDLYVVNAGNLYVVDALNGSIKLTIPLPNAAGDYYTSSKPAVYQGTVFINFQQYLYALNPDTGQIKWTYQESTAISRPTISSGIIYITGGNRITALYVDTGSIKWQILAWGDYASSNAYLWAPTIADDTLFVGAIEAYDADTGNLKWSYTTAYEDLWAPYTAHPTSAVVVGGYVFVGTTRNTSLLFDSSDGRLYVFKKNMGELAYLYEQGTKLNSWTGDPAAVVGNGMVVLNFATNHLAAFSIDSIKGISGFKGTDYISKLDPLACHEDSYIADPINTSTGAHEIERTLLTLNGAQPLPFKVRYNSLLLAEGPLGKGWAHNFETRLEELPSGDITIHWSGNRSNGFTKNASGEYMPQDRAILHDTLIKNQDGSYALTRKDQSVYIFDAQGKLTTQKNGHGQQFDMSYDASGKLTRVEEPISGKTINFTYNASGFIESATDNLNRQVSFGYDVDRNLTSITDAKNQATTYTYNQAGQVLTATDAEGIRLFSNTYDSQGRVIEQDDAVSTNQTARFSYDEISDPGKLITTATDRNGKTRVLTHNYKYELLSIKDELQNVSATYTYDADGNRLSAKDAEGNITKFTYDSRGNLLTITDPKNNKSTMTYDARSNLLSVENALGKKITYTYDENNNLTSTSDPLDNVTTYTYNSNGLLLEKTAPKQGKTIYTYQSGLPHTIRDSAENTTTLSYDDAGRLISIKDALSKETTMTYDAADNIIAVKDPLGHTRSFTYDSHHSKLTETDAKGNITRFTYNDSGKLISKIDALNNETRYEYDGEDRLVKTIDARGNAAAFSYDDKGRLTGITDPLGNTQTIEYDALDNVIGKKDALGNKVLSISYDELNNPITIKDALGNTITKSYDALSRVDSITDPMSKVTQFTYDELNRMVSSTDAMAGLSRQGFDADGNSTSLVDPNGNQTNFNFDKAGRLVARASATGDITRYSYNAKNLLAEVENGRIQLTTYQYDDAGRLIGFTDPDGAVAYTLDANGNILSTTEGTRTVTREYDALDRITKYTDAQGNIIQYAYNAVGNLTTLTYPGGRQVTYGYDAANRLTSVTDWAGRVTAYEYDTNGRLTKTTRPNGTMQTRTYDAAGQLLQQKDIDTAGNVTSQFDFIYDAAGNVKVEQSSSEEATFTASNTTMTYGSDNRLLTYNEEPVMYDEDGNMVFGPLADTMANYTFDSRNRLTSAGGTTYLYDAENNRIGSIEDSKTTDYVVNPNARLSQVLIKTDDQGNQTFYIYGLGLIGQEETDGTYKTYHFDRRGSTVAITDITGNVTDRFQYAPYGELVHREGQTSTPFLFNGRYGVMTDNNGLYYMRARYYNPEIKRFINMDVLTGSIDNGQSLNRYAYTNGNPISYIDPFGLSRDGDDFYWLDGLQLVFDLAGLVPIVGEFFDLANAGIYWWRGDKLSAGLSAGSAIPFIGWAGTAGKFGVKGTKFSRLVRKSEKVAGDIGDDFITLFHGSIDHATHIRTKGLDPDKIPTFVTTSREAAENAIGSQRVLRPDQGLDRGMIESRITREEFEALKRSGAISENRSWPGFGTQKVFPENVLRSREAVDAFNRGIWR